MGSYSTDDHMNSKNIHIYKNLFLKGFKKKKKKLPTKGGEKNTLRLTEVFRVKI